MVVIVLQSPAVNAADVVQGVFALPGSEELVTGEMTLRETGPLTREMTLVYSDKATGRQIPKFDVELTQQLHILATDDELSTLIHQHVEHAGSDGTFSTSFEFPAPGLYHVYTDAVPSGYGQQVVRFDVTIGNETNETTAPVTSDERPSPISGKVLESSSDGYTVKLDVGQLQAQQESAVSISVEKDGAPAQDLSPYLGVAAHAVFIRADDLAYVHAHASGKTKGSQSLTRSGGHAHGDHGAANPQDSSSAPAQSSHGGHHEQGPPENADSHGASGSHGAAGRHAAPDHASQHTNHGDASSSGSVPPEMDLFVTPPAPGAYALWIEFMGGGEVHTIPFKLEIPPKS